MTTRMTQEEREAYLADLHVGVLSIAEQGRGPLTAPIWYAYEPGGHVRFVIDDDSRKAALIARGTRVSLCIQTEESPYKYVSVEGPVLSIEAAELEGHERPLAHRYLGKREGDRYLEFNSAHEGGRVSLAVQMRPERWLTVDYSKEDVGL